MLNAKNLKPNERVDEMLLISDTYGRLTIISYLLTELAINSKHKNFSDECYWKEVQEEFNSRIIQFKTK
jgi:hypothetical protein